MTSSITPPIIIALLFYLIYKHIIHPALIYPLSKIPYAHPTAFLPTWIWWKRRAGYESRTIDAAHKRKGPIIRLAPNEVSVNSLEGLRKIYVGGFERTDWFLLFRNYDNTPNLVTMFDSKTHGTRKRMLAHIYSKSYLLDSANIHLLSHVLLFERLVPVLEGSMGSEGVNVLNLTLAAGAEFMSAYAMGLGNDLDLVRVGKEVERTRYIDRGRVKLRGTKDCKEAVRELEEQCSAMCEKAKQQVLNSEFGSLTPAQTMQEQARTYPVVYAQLSASLLANEGNKAAQEIDRLIASELIDSIEAAREGIGIAATYAMHELSKRPALQSVLREELLTLEHPLFYPSQSQISTSILRQLESLPWLEAITTETLRLHAPAPGPQRRVVPINGAIIEGYFIPAGVTVSSSPYAMHRYQGAFPDAEAWKPERWMNLHNPKDKKTSQTANTKHDLERYTEENDPRRWFLTFGRGGRMCIGSNFATLVSKLILASIYTNFTTTIIDDAGIEHRDEISAAPVGDKLILKFDRV